MDIKILHYINGAKNAEGLTVIIDVFRAFSLECYIMSKEAKAIIPVADISDAYRLKAENPDYILVGERNGAKCEGFDYGNSPYQIENADLKGKTIIHTTSAGTQGIANAANASEIITGSFVNANAIAEFIKRRNPDTVSLVCMGNAGIYVAQEDIFCAEYIRSLLLGESMDITRFAEELKTEAGKHFFDPKKQDVFPEQDFWMCMQINRFSFILKVNKNKTGFKVTKECMLA